MAVKYRLKLGDKETQVEVEESGEGLRAGIDGVWRETSLQQIGGSAQYSIIVDGQTFQVFAEETPHGYHVIVGGRSFDVTTNLASSKLRKPPDSDLSTVQTADDEWVLGAPMTGVIQKIFVSPNDTVAPGDVLMIIEAMKMQNELRARHAGQVKAVYVSEGQQVEQGTPLLVLL